MRLFHVSEESNIEFFKPRIPDRDDLDKTIGLVWAIDDLRLPNFLTPRDCPRVTYHISKNATEEDIKKYFTSSTTPHVIIIESKWFDIMKNTTIYLYEFDPHDFVLQDEVAGYYVAKTTQVPIAKYPIDDLFSALFERHVELRVVDNLWSAYDEIKKTSLNWSMCRMKFAQKRK